MPAHQNERRFPRVPFNEPAELVFRSPRSGVRLASFRDVSPEGFGMLVDGECALALGEQISVRFMTQPGLRLEIPGRVVHARAQRNERCVGIKLFLELAPTTTRQDFARWIVAKLGAARSSSRHLTMPRR